MEEKLIISNYEDVELKEDLISKNIIVSFGIKTKMKKKYIVTISRTIRIRKMKEGVK